MSFSAEVKEELAGVIPPQKALQAAELAALLFMSGGILLTKTGEKPGDLVISTENEALARKLFTLLQKIYKLNPDISVRKGKNKSSGTTVTLSGPLLEALQRDYPEMPQGLPLRESEGFGGYQASTGEEKRALLRGAFLAAGSISDPAKSYHLELVCDNPVKAALLQQAFEPFGLEAKTVQRKRYSIVYLKESNQIVDALNVMGASVSLMDMENIRILREIKGAVNRKFNCEMANINKTVSAAVLQADDIRIIQERMGLENLPDTLRTVALLRMERPQATLRELGQALDPPVGKSGVNHRLRKLKQIADDLRQES